jgi:ceramide glucosyltransferase
LSGLIHLAGELMAALAIAGMIYGVIATGLTVRSLSRRATPQTVFPSVTLLKPLHGAYPDMGAVLEAFCDQDYPGRVQILFGVQDAADPAVAVIEALMARRPDADIGLIVDSTSHGANRKISNVINIAAHGRHDVLVLTDADILPPPTWLRHVTRALGDKGVGAVTCFYVGQDDGTWWSRLGAMAITYSFLPNAVLGKTLGLAEPCFGSTIALRGETLAAMGGFETFANHLADDFEIGRAIRALGATIAIPPVIVRHLGHEADLNALFDHELRWGRTVRQIDPAGYAGSVITNPLPLAVLAGALLGFSPLGLGLILASLGVRIACKFAMDWITGTSAGQWWMIPVRDALSLCVFIASFAVNTVGWQGRRFRVGRDGVLSIP